MIVSTKGEPPLVTDGIDCYKEIAIQVPHTIIHFLYWTETQKGCPDQITNQAIGQINRWFKRTPVQQGLALSCGKVTPSLKFYVLSKGSVLYNVGLLWKVILLFFCLTLLSSSRKEVEESLASESLTLQLWQRCSSVKGGRWCDAEQGREPGESKQCLREQKRRLCRAQGKGRKKVSIYIASPSYHHIPL